MNEISTFCEEDIKTFADSLIFGEPLKIYVGGIDSERAVELSKEFSEITGIKTTVVPNNKIKTINELEFND